MSETQKKQIKKKMSTSKANDLTENQKFSERTFNFSKTPGETFVNKHKRRKLSENNPVELMNRLEEYSAVWNDCPDMTNSLFATNHLPENNELPFNDVRKGSAKVSIMNSTKKVGDYFQLSVSDSQNNYEPNKWATNINDKKFKLRDSPKTLSTSENVKNKKNSNLEENAGGYLDPHNSENNSSKLADLKRKKAVNEQRQLHVDQKKIIKQALSALDGSKVNKKVVFSDDNYCEINEQRRNNQVAGKANEKTKRLQLFEENDDFEIETNLKLNPQFEGIKGQKLLDLQSKYASDSRFNLDTRFYDSGTDGSENENPENEKNTSEKEKHLAILGSIVNKQIKPLSEIKKSSVKKTDHKWMVRFDPMREDHKYLLKPKEIHTHASTKDTFVEKKKTETNNLENKIQVSDEKFYSVKEDLKEVLNTESKTEFSLLKLFGPKETPDLSTENESPQKIKKLKYNNKNPFKFDSSDSEHEEEKLPISKGSKGKGSLTQLSIKTWRTTFFFTDNDSRLQEAWEFLKAPDVQEDDKEFAEKRKILKVFIKNKFKNYKKNGLFKKKLGGLKRKPILKKKSRTS